MRLLKRYINRHGVVNLLPVLFFLLSALPSFGQLYTANPRLFTLKTEFFDIIYPEESAVSARFVAEHADRLYRELANFFGTKPDLRLPVVITPDTSLLNAYFTVLPYNRIVLFDTLPADGSLAVFRQTQLSVFAHELTHAVTANIKSPFWRGASRVFGDILSPSMILNMVPSFIEGAAVLTESREGDGRLNDPAVMQVLIQAKLENKFPSWQQASGARDIYPSGDLPYVYGGAFSHFIYQKYGAEKFRQLWKTAGKVQFALSAGIFKKVYGLTLKQAWADFENCIPAVPAALPESAPVQRLTKTGGRYASLVSSGSTLAWIDGASSSVYVREKNGRRRKVLSYSMVERLDISPDNKLLLLSAAEYDGSLYHDRARIYHLEREKFLPITLQLREACFVTPGEGDFAVAGISVQSQFASLVLYRGGQKKTLIDFSYGASAFSPVDCGNGWLALILAEQNERTLILYNIATGEIRKTAPNLPQGAVFTGLAAAPAQKQSECRLLFSWTESQSLSRLGEIVINFETSSSVTLLSDLLLSGGMHEPAALEGGVAYIAHFFNRDELYAVNTPVFKNRLPLAVETVLLIDKKQAAVQEGLKSETATDFLQERYKPFSYFGKGILAPVAVNALQPAYFGDLGFLGLGLTYFTMDPAEKYTLLVSGGYDFFLGTTSFYSEFSSAATPVRLLFQAGLTFDKFLTPLLRAGFTASHTLPLRDSHTYWYFEDKVQLVTDFSGWNAANDFQVYYSTVHKTGLGYFEKGGVKLGAGNTLFLNPFEAKFYGLFGFELPQLLPFKNPQNFTVNFPLSADLKPSIENLEISASVVLFSAEIQRGIPFLPLYVNRITLEAAYEGKLGWMGNFTRQQASAAVYGTFSPLAGTATSVSFDAGLRYTYDILQNNWIFSFAGAFRL